MKSYHIIAIAAFCCLLSSCITVTYLGDRLEPTSAIDIYYSTHDVKREYKMIGHLTCTNAGERYVKAKLVAYAKNIGADAVVITGTDATKDNQAAVVNADALKYEK